MFNGSNIVDIAKGRPPFFNIGHFIFVVPISQSMDSFPRKAWLKAKSLSWETQRTIRLSLRRMSRFLFQQLFLKMVHPHRYVISIT